MRGGAVHVSGEGAYFYGMRIAGKILNVKRDIVHAGVETCFVRAVYINIYFNDIIVSAV
jgi:hypothetical protein